MGEGAAAESGSGGSTVYDGVGVGIGTAAVAGPVARMGRPPPEPPDVPASARTVDECVAMAGRATAAGTARDARKAALRT